MISYLKGVVAAKLDESILVVNNDLGFEVFVPAPLWRKMKSGDQIAVFTHEHVREDSRDLFGFASLGELGFFKKLIGISGIGPKLALNLMSLGTLAELQAAIASGNVSYLTAIPRVGTKSAQKIVLEMRGRLDLTEGASPEDRDAIEALESLGYSRSQAREALRRVPGDVVEVDERVRAALKTLGQKVR